MTPTAEYYRHKRSELSACISRGHNRIFELGCAEGFFGEILKKEGLASEVIGLEVFPLAAKAAESRLDRVICGDIETMSVTSMGLEQKSFDYVVCGDVLEHLRDPWRVITSLGSLLKQDGLLIISVPNVRHWSVTLPLLFQGVWEYKEEGIMDRTHLRFFTLKTARDLVHRAKFDVVRISPIRRRKIDRLASAVSFGLLDELTAYQWLLVAKTATTADER